MLASPYYDKLLRVLLDPANRNGRDGKIYRLLAEALQDPNTKRIMFDSRQAIVFEDLDEAPPNSVLPKLHLPFQQFYLEFTEPIKIGEPEPGYEDFARSMLIVGDVAQVKVGDLETLLHLNNVTYFFTELGGASYVDRTFKLHLESGMAVTSKQAATTGADPSDLPDDWKDEQYFACGTTGRYAGWWERTCLDYASLFCWMDTYMMCKSVVIEQEWVSRQVKRWHERHDTIPRPWHIVKLDPKLTMHRKPGEETDIHHSYRYDVIGHLRFQHQKLKSGEHKTIIEWVCDHQRGLANSLYIPKTYSIEAGRNLAKKQMKEYFNADLSGDNQDKPTETAG